MGQKERCALRCQALRDLERRSGLVEFGEQGQITMWGVVKRGFVILLACECVAGAAFLGYVFEQRLAAADEYDRQVKLAQEDGERLREQVVLRHDERVSAGQNFTAALHKFGLSAKEATSASAAAQRAFNLRQLRAGNTITVGRSVEGELREINYKIDADRMLKIVPEEGGFIARVSEIPSKTEIVAASGRVDDSLFNAVEDGGESAEQCG